MLESWLQANLQLFYLTMLISVKMLQAFYEYSWFETNLLFGFGVSCVSIIYGLSTFNLRKILRDEPSILKTLLFTLTELCTTFALFLYLPAIWLISLEFDIVFILYIGIPIIGAYQLSLRILGPNKGYFSIDYRINFCLKCQELDSLQEMVIARRRLVIVNMIYVLVTTAASNGVLYYHKLNPLCVIPNLPFDCFFHSLHMIVFLAWNTACILSFLQNAIELLFILIAKKSFLDWAFKAGLEEEARLARLREQERLEELEENSLLVIKMSEL